MTGPSPLGRNSAAGKSTYGKRLLPQVLDERAASNPDRVYATVTLTPSVPESYREVTFGQVAKATNFFAHWLNGHLENRQDFETLAYLGLPDLRNPIIFLAAVKCGYKVCGQVIILPSVQGLTNHRWSASSPLPKKYGCYKSFLGRTDQMHKVSLFSRVEAFSPQLRAAKARFEGLSNTFAE